MERWSGRVAVVTGASSGIGAAIAQLLVKKGMKVVGVARRVERIQALADDLKDAPGKLFAVKTDLSKEEDILAAFQWIKDNLGGVDILVNNAAAGIMTPLTSGKTSEWRQLLDLNVLALSICTKEAIKSMKERGVDDGHIFHINSVAGHYIGNFPGTYMYTGTKHAVTALTEGLRKELVSLKSSIRVTSISPGLVDTEMVRGPTIPQDAFKDMPMLQPQDIAEAVLYALSAPARVQALADDLQDAPGKLFAVKTDLSKEEDILTAFEWIKDNLGGVDVLVNNAAAGITTHLTSGNTCDWRQMLDVNVLALSICTKEAIKSMKERGVDDGHIFHINSVAGHNIINFPCAHMYSGTKHTVTALTGGLMKELAYLKSSIRVTSVSPGLVDTEMIRGPTIPQDIFKFMPMLQPHDITEAVLYALSAPARVQVHEIIIYSTGEKI